MLTLETVKSQRGPSILKLREYNLRNFTSKSKSITFFKAKNQ